jgi:hypothetical protein
MVHSDSFHATRGAVSSNGATEQHQWRKELLATAFQGGVTSDIWLEALLDRLEGRQ